jgi:hypothetical protein
MMGDYIKSDIHIFTQLYDALIKLKLWAHIMDDTGASDMYRMILN